MADTLMYPLNKSGISTGILYDRVYPFAGLHSFNTLHGNPDTSSYDHFYQAYSEIYNAAYNKSSLMNSYRLDTIAKAMWYTNQIVPIGILCYDLNVIDTNSIAKNYFYRGSDSLLHDVAGRTGNPYLLKTVTVAAALATDTLDYGSGSFQFKYYSGLFFTNKGITITSLVADFGTGAQNITAGGTITISYTSGGTKTVKFTISYSNGQQAITYSNIFIRPSAGMQTMRFGQDVKPDEIRHIADTKYGFQGYNEPMKLYNNGDYGIYYHRTSLADPLKRK